jgi:transposase
MFSSLPMLGSTRNVSVYIAPGPTDMRKGYNGLFAIARDTIKMDPLSGHLFLFVAKNRKRCKVLYWDGTGLCVFQKRLESGRFIAPWKRPGTSAVTMTSNELQLFIEGSEKVRGPLSRVAFRP